MMYGNKCELCGIKDREINDKGKPTVLNVHHLIPRENKALRFDLHNACVLCRNHHKYAKNSAHKGSLLFYEWFRNYRPADYYYVMQHCGDEPIDTVEKIKDAIISLDMTKEILENKRDEGGI